MDIPQILLIAYCSAHTQNIFSSPTVAINFTLEGSSINKWNIFVERPVKQSFTSTMKINFCSLSGT
jgi:hypothetical protein